MLNKVKFFSRTEFFPVEDKLWPGQNMASSGLKKMLTLTIIFKTLDVWVLVCPVKDPKLFLSTISHASILHPALHPTTKGLTWLYNTPKA